MPVKSAIPTRPKVLMLRFRTLVAKGSCATSDAALASLGPPYQFLGSASAKKRALALRSNAARGCAIRTCVLAARWPAKVQYSHAAYHLASVVVTPALTLMTEASIAVVDSKALLSLFGPRDQHLKQIRDALGVRISARSDQIRVEGPEEAVT